MGLTSTGRNYFRNRIGSNVTLVSHMGIGSGSGIFDSATSGLYREVSRRAFSTGYPAYGTTDVIELQADWGSTEISGLTIREFGTFIGNTGSTAIQKAHFTGISFDGSNELQVTVEIKVL